LWKDSFASSGSSLPRTPEVVTADESYEAGIDARPEWSRQVVYAGTRTSGSNSESFDSTQQLPDDSIPRSSVDPYFAHSTPLSTVQVHVTPLSAAETSFSGWQPDDVAEFRGPGLAPVAAYQARQVMMAAGAQGSTFCFSPPLLHSLYLAAHLPSLYYAGAFIPNPFPFIFELHSGALSVCEFPLQW
jgi:hypothetical protein